ncbi:MAG: diguanylate cyclase [Candidatus Thiodiazotropha sp.]
MLLVLSLLLFGPSHNLWGIDQQTPSSVILSEGFNDVGLEGKIYFLSDPQRQLGIDAVSSPVHVNDFKSGSGNIGFTNAAVWVRYTLTSHLETRRRLILEIDYPLIDEIEFYQPDGVGGFEVRLGGDTNPFVLREIKFRNTLFTFEIEPGQSVTYYMRLVSRGPIQVPVKVWEFKAFAEHSSTTLFWHGLYFGAILLLIVSSIVGFYLFRTSLFLWYAFYLSCYGLLNFTVIGLSSQHLWPETPVLQEYASSILLSLVVIGAMIFSGKLLDLRQYSITYFYLFRVIILLALVGMVISLSGYLVLANQITTLSGMALVPIVISAAAVVYRRGNLAARYFLLAWGVFLVFVFISGLYYWGVLPYGFFTAYALQIGSVFEVTMLGVAIADRIALINKEKEKADKLANNYLVILNEKLEELVHERTEELVESNRKLHKLATHDSLTLLLNHHSIINALKTAISAAERLRQPLCIAMIDVDQFKQINDKFGHQVGDNVLVAIANTFTRSLRAYDVAGRYGGEEFLLILPQTNAENATELIERLRENITELIFSGTQGKGVTVSVGMTSYQCGIEMNTDTLIRCADIALYRAKENGRDRIEWGNCVAAVNDVRSS